VSDSVENNQKWTDPVLPDQQNRASLDREMTEGAMKKMFEIIVPLATVAPEFGSPNDPFSDAQAEIDTLLAKPGALYRTFCLLIHHSEPDL